MSCSLPHNHYCCLLPSTVCLPHLLICTCLISSPIACPPSSVLCWCLLGLFCFFFIFSFVRNGDDYVAIFICVFVHVFFLLYLAVHIMLSFYTFCHLLCSTVPNRTWVNYLNHRITLSENYWFLLFTRDESDAETFTKTNILLLALPFRHGPGLLQ